MQKDDIDLYDYLEVIIRKWKMIVLLTLLIVLFTFFITLAWPKTYNSVSVIRLAEVSNSFIIAPENTKVIIKSSTIVEPVLKDFYGEDNSVSLQTFSRKHLEADIVKEVITSQEVKVASYLRLTVKFKNAEDSYKFNLAIANEFVNYENMFFNQSIEYLKEKSRLIKENEGGALSEIQGNIETLKKDIFNLRNQINSLGYNSLSSEGLSKSTLLQSILQASLDSLQKQEERQLELQKSFTNADIDLQRNLDLAKEARLETLPEIPRKYSSPNMNLNLAIGFFAGLFISLFLTFLQEGFKKQKK